MNKGERGEKAVIREREWEVLDKAAGSRRPRPDARAGEQGRKCKGGGLTGAAVWRWIRLTHAESCQEALGSEWPAESRKQRDSK